MSENSEQYTIPLVMHGIVPDGKRVLFEDVELSTFREILNFCGDHCINFNDRLAPSKSAPLSYLLTFDDGLASDALIALPLLVEKKCPSISFVISEKIGTQGFLTPYQLREMVTSGVMIGSHSVSHSDFTLLSEEAQLKEFKVSKDMIEDCTGMPVRDFSFPFGRFNSRAIELGFMSGYERIFTSKHGIMRNNSNVIPRNSINGSMSLRRVRKTLEASASTRFAWIMEDYIKTALIDSLTPAVYLKIRGLSVGG